MSDARLKTFESIIRMVSFTLLNVCPCKHRNVLVYAQSCVLSTSFRHRVSFADSLICARLICFLFTAIVFVLGPKLTGYNQHLLSDFELMQFIEEVLNHFHCFQ